MIVYALALLGALIEKAGTIAGVAAARGTSPRLYDAIGVLCYAACYPIWKGMSSAAGGGYAEPGAVWGMVGAVITLVAVLAFNEPMSRARFVLLIAGTLLLASREIVP